MTGNYLFIDDNKDSIEARGLLEKLDIEFVTHDLTQYKDHDFEEVPILFCPDGQFYGLDRIRSYIEMKYGES